MLRGVRYAVVHAAGLMQIRQRVEHCANGEFFKYLCIAEAVTASGEKGLADVHASSFMAI